MLAPWSDTDTTGLDDLGLLVYRSRLLGADLAVVNRGGGNTSMKRRVTDFRGREVEVLTIKGTGADLKAISPSEFVDLRLEDLQPLKARAIMTDDQMVAYLARCQLDPQAPRASIETLLHAFIPARHVDHSHAELSLALATAEHGADIARTIFGDELAWIPYVRPGFGLARRALDALAAKPKARFALLQKHGVVTWADDPKACYQQHQEFLERCQAYVDDKTKGRRVFAVPSPDVAAAPSLAEAVLPELRGLLAGDGAPPVLYHDASPEVLAFVASPEGRELARSGLACPDHVLYTKVLPLVLDTAAAAKPEQLLETLAAAVPHYVTDYQSYFQRHRAPEDAMMAPLPTVVLAPGLGMVTAGRDQRSARLAAEAYRRAINIMEQAAALDRFVPLTEAEAYEVEYWPLELYKLTLQPPERELARRVALVTGGGGAIGRAICARLAAEGAQVVVADINLESARAVAQELCEAYGDDAALALPLDVTDPASVAAAIAASVRSYGGLDILVCNAGIAYSHPIEETSLKEWQQTLDVLVTGYFLTAQEGIQVMRRQRRSDGSCAGGSIIFVASKAGVAAARNASAYATAKAAVLHLARCLVEEVSEDGIRVNSLAPDAIITGSGLWAGQWGQARAAAHGVPLDRLPEFYRGRNLLKTAVTAEDVAEAALFFASPRSRATTAAILTVDGGLHDGYVR